MSDAYNRHVARTYRQIADDNPLEFNQRVADELDAWQAQQQWAAYNAQAQAQHAQDVLAFKNWLGEIDQEFEKSHPDYGKALNHIRTQRLKQIKGAYPDVPEDAIKAELARGELNFALGEIAQGRHPSESAYRAAKDGFGYGEEAEVHYRHPHRQEYNRDFNARLDAADEYMRDNPPEGEEVFNAAMTERYGDRGFKPRTFDEGEERFGTLLPEGKHDG